MMRLGPPATLTAIRNGLWHRSNTWDQGRVPEDGESVEIPADFTVWVQRRETARIKYIHIEGTLAMLPQRTTRLLVETIFVAEMGKFMIGSPNSRVLANKSAEVVIIHHGGPVEDPEEMGRGVVTMGAVKIFGHRKTHRANIREDVEKGSQSLRLIRAAPEDWAIGDEIVLAGTHFHRETSSQEEKLRITGIAGRDVSFEPELLYDHRLALPEFKMHVVNLTRNVVFRSEATRVPLRGHMMFMGSDVRIDHAAFINLGRTNKAIPLDEVLVNFTDGTTTPNPNIRNRRGRYALHFHLNGNDPEATLPPSKVFGCVVVGTPGWGFVNHSSHVDFRRNICYDFVGAGFVTESGDELGNFLDNVAIRGTGNGEYLPDRVIFKNHDRAQPLSDFGFAGDGFWFQGPAIRVRNNVANGCNGAGMIWFTTGAIDINTGRYIGMPESTVRTVYADYPNSANLNFRHWVDPEAPPDSTPDTPPSTPDLDNVILSDLPILQCVGFEAYGNLVGFRLRFNNHNNVSFYDEVPYAYHEGIVPMNPGSVNIFAANRLRQTIEKLRLWNNEQGIRVRYNEKTDWDDVQIANQLRYRLRSPHLGAELFHNADSNVFTDLLIQGYPIAALTNFHDPKVARDNRGEITFVDFKFQDCASENTWHAEIACAQPGDISVEDVSSESAKISWSRPPDTARVLIRYRVRGDESEPWHFAVESAAGETSKRLSELEPATPYVFQIMAGCELSVSLWSPEFSFITAS